MRGAGGARGRFAKTQLALAFVFLGFANSPTVAQAASAPAPTPSPVTRPTTPLDLTTSPLPITLSASPGETVSTSIKVKQSGGDTEALQVNLLKFSAYGEAGEPALSSFGPGDDYKNWVTFDKPTFEAPNDVWQTVKMTIALPKTAAFEYNYAVQFSRVGDNLSPGGKDVEGVAGSTAVLVLLNVNAPGENRSVQLDSFGVVRKIVQFLPTTFEARFYNNGNVYVQPTGDIFITQGKHQVGMVLLNDEQGNLLAGTHRIYQINWADGFPYYEPTSQQGKPVVDRHGNVVQSLNWNLPNSTTAALTSGVASTTNPDMAQESTNPLSRFRFGEYTARLVAVYQDNYGRDVPITAQINFWVIPWWLLLALLAVLLVFGFAIYSLVASVMRRRRRLERIKRRRRNNS